MGKKGKISSNKIVLVCVTATYGPAGCSAQQAIMWKFKSGGQFETVYSETHADPRSSPVSYLQEFFFSPQSNLVGFSERLLTALTPKDSVKENEAFLYNPAIMPTMTSANNNQPHNQKYVTQSHKTPEDHYDGLRCSFSGRCLCRLVMLKYCKVRVSGRPDGDCNRTKRGHEETQPAYVLRGKERMKTALHLRQTGPDGNRYAIFKAQLSVC